MEPWKEQLHTPETWPKDVELSKTPGSLQTSHFRGRFETCSTEWQKEGGETSGLPWLKDRSWAQLGQLQASS